MATDTTATDKKNSGDQDEDDQIDEYSEEEDEEDETEEMEVLESSEEEDDLRTHDQDSLANFDKINYNNDDIITVDVVHEIIRKAFSINGIR